MFPFSTGKSLQSSEPLSPVAYICPSVTISQGKESTRKEYKVRQSTGGTLPSTSNNEKNFSTSTNPKMGITLDKEINRIESICREWEGHTENEILEETQNLIDVAVVENLGKRFASLETLKANNWQEVLPEKEITVQKRGRGRPKQGTATSSLKDAINAARCYLCLEDIVENLLTRTPLKEHSTPVLQSSNRKSLRVSLLDGSAFKHFSSSPGPTMSHTSHQVG
ncbi:hypothetical protein JTB14_006455 [Gonioctena quinquepunctata]|nr:hypothetical protein JTB14_006455 [Gonioctena quinquepunctata]